MTSTIAKRRRAVKLGVVTSLNVPCGSGRIPALPPRWGLSQIGNRVSSRNIWPPFDNCPCGYWGHRQFGKECPAHLIKSRPDCCSSGFVSHDVAGLTVIRQVLRKGSILFWIHFCVGASAYVGTITTWPILFVTGRQPVRTYSAEPHGVVTVICQDAGSLAKARMIAPVDEHPQKVIMLAASADNTNVCFIWSSSLRARNLSTASFRPPAPPAAAALTGCF